MKRYSPWVFFNKSAHIAESNLELNLWKKAFSKYVTSYVIDESVSNFDADHIDSSILNILKYSDSNQLSFLCSLHFGESIFPKESFKFLKQYGLKRICVLTSEGISDGLYNEISLGLFDFVLVDSVSEYFGVKNIIHDINPFMEVVSYDNIKTEIVNDQAFEWKILVDKIVINDIVLNRQIKQMCESGVNAHVDDMRESSVSRPINGWIVLPQMLENIMVLKKAVILHESGEKVFVPKEMFDSIKCCIPYNSLQDIKNWSINSSIEMNKIFKCSDISDFGIRMLSIIHGS